MSSLFDLYVVCWNLVHLELVCSCFDCNALGWNILSGLFSVLPLFCWEVAASPLDPWYSGLTDVRLVHRWIINNLSQPIMRICVVFKVFLELQRCCLLLCFQSKALNVLGRFRSLPQPAGLHRPGVLYVFLFWRSLWIC